MNVAVTTEVTAAAVSYFFVFPEYGLLGAAVAFVLVNLIGFVGFLSCCLANLDGGSRTGAAALAAVFVLSVYYGGSFLLGMGTDRFPEHGLVIDRYTWRPSQVKQDPPRTDVIASYEMGSSQLLLFLDQARPGMPPDAAADAGTDKYSTGGYRQVGGERAYWNLTGSKSSPRVSLLNVWIPRQGRPILRLSLSPIGDFFTRRAFWRFVDRIEFTSKNDE